MSKTQIYLKHFSSYESVTQFVANKVCNSLNFDDSYVVLNIRKPICIQGELQAQMTDWLVSRFPLGQQHPGKYLLFPRKVIQYSTALK